MPKEQFDNDEGKIMRDYGVVSSSFWTTPGIHELSDNGKLLAVYLLTGPHSNMIGCYRIPIGYISEDLKWSQRTCVKALYDLHAVGFASHDSASQFILIHKYLEWNPIENPNQGKLAEKLIFQIPGNFSLMRELTAILETVSERLPEGFQNRFRTLSKPFRNQDQEQDQDHDQDPTKNQTINQAPDERFDRFWKEYPRKIGKGAARKSWDKIKGQPDVLEKIIHALLWQVRSEQWIKEGGQFIPHPATYLNQGRWDDEPVVPFRPKTALDIQAEKNRIEREQWEADLQREREEKGIVVP